MHCWGTFGDAQIPNFFSPGGGPSCQFPIFIRTGEGRSGSISCISSNGIGFVCLSQLITIVALGAHSPFPRMVYASYAYRNWSRSPLWTHIPRFPEWYMLRVLIVGEHCCALGAVPPLLNTTMAARRERKFGTVYWSKSLIRLYKEILGARRARKFLPI